MAFLCNENMKMGFAYSSRPRSEISRSDLDFLSNECLYQASDQNGIPDVGWYRGIDVVYGSRGIVEKFGEE